MMIPFTKYQGAGNDFILLDERDTYWLDETDPHLIAQWCDRRFGIGADGLMLLRNRIGYDFEMVYFNADGRPGSMCGNGGRCMVDFARHLGIIAQKAYFLAVDGPHRAQLTRPGWVELQMGDVNHIEEGADYYFLDTGSPHYVRFVRDLSGIDVVGAGRAIRYNDRFREKGTNVNFVETQDQCLVIATYERGVEDETLACGTGITAAALAHSLMKNGAGATVQRSVRVQAKGGVLEVRFRQMGKRFTDIWLCGPAQRVFEGFVAEKNDKYEDDKFDQ